MHTHAMDHTIRALVTPPKGILAADESLSTIAKRFKATGIAESEENRRAYRELLFTTPGLNEFIGGAILFDETIRQMDRNGIPLIEQLKRNQIVPGIKVDQGAKALAGFPGEKITEGLDFLRERLAGYQRAGAAFTKWRAVITMGPILPTTECIEANAHALARFAALSQEAGLVPIVEPEVLMDGEHTIGRHFEATERTLHGVFRALVHQRVRLETMLLKTNMVLAGTECPERAEVSEVAELTLRCLKRAVPAAVPGIVFLSGGQTDVQATTHLNAINQLGDAPWELSFSFGRALQDAAMKAWAGKAANLMSAQRELHHRARCNAAARAGSYTPDLEKQVN